MKEKPATTTATTTNRQTHAYSLTRDHHHTNTHNHYPHRQHRCLWVSHIYRSRQHCNDYFDTNNDDEWIAEKRFVYFSRHLSILVAAFSCWTNAPWMSGNVNGNNISSIKNHWTDILCAYFPLNNSIYKRLVSMSTNAFTSGFFQSLCLPRL